MMTTKTQDQKDAERKNLNTEINLKNAAALNQADIALHARLDEALARVSVVETQIVRLLTDNATLRAQVQQLQVLAHGSRSSTR